MSAVIMDGKMLAARLKADITEQVGKLSKKPGLGTILVGEDPGSKAYVELANILASSSNILANFFDGDQSVMVMVEDPDIRRNRLNMLGILKNQAYILADFSCLNATFDSPCS